MRKFICLALALAASPSYAQEDGWYHVSTSNDDSRTYSIKLGSGERSQNRQGEPITVVVGKTAYQKPAKVEVAKWYVTDADCAREYGSLVILKVDGTHDFDAAFAQGSENIASSIAETICYLTSAEQKKANGKSI